MRRVGFGPSRKNPGLCNTCFEKAPMGGVEMEIGVLFADIRGFTSLAETLPPQQVAELLNRFYACASGILSRSAVIDKLVGDEVMALYIPQLLGKHWEDELVRDARELLEAVGFGSDASRGCRSGSASTRARRSSATSARAKSRTSPPWATSSTPRPASSPRRSPGRS